MTLANLTTLLDKEALMQALIVPVYGERESSANSRVPWLYAVALCLYYLFAYYGLVRATPIFSQMLNGIGVELPLPTRLLMMTYWWVFPIVFIGGVIVTIAKQIVPFNKRHLRAANALLIFVGVVFPSVVVLTWYLPLFVLIHRLSQSH